MGLWADAKNIRDKDPAARNVAEVIIAKQRNGPIGTVNLGWKPELTRFVNMAKEQ